MKVKIVKDNLLQSFQAKFTILFEDQEFGFKADDKLIAHISSSLSYEQIDENLENISVIRQDAVSCGIFFLYQGQVQMFWRNTPHHLVTFEVGSYFGDISFIFQIRNQYRYIPMKKDSKNEIKIFSLQDRYLT